MRSAVEFVLLACYSAQKALGSRNRWNLWVRNAPSLPPSGLLLLDILKLVVCQLCVKQFYSLVYTIIIMTYYFDLFNCCKLQMDQPGLASLNIDATPGF